MSHIQISIKNIISIISIIGIVILVYRLHWAYNPVQRYWRNTDSSPPFFSGCASKKGTKRGGLKIQCERYNLYNYKPDTFNNIIPTESVINYERVIPTNSTQTKPNKTKSLNIFSFVEPNKRPPGHYNESNVDLLVTNGLFTIGSNWLYDAVFAV